MKKGKHWTKSWCCFFKLKSIVWTTPYKTCIFFISGTVVDNPNKDGTIALDLKFSRYGKTDRPIVYPSEDQVLKYVADTASKDQEYGSIGRFSVVSFPNSRLLIYNSHLTLANFTGMTIHTLWSHLLLWNCWRFTGFQMALIPHVIDTLSNMDPQCYSKKGYNIKNKAGCNAAMSQSQQWQLIASVIRQFLFYSVCCLHMDTIIQHDIWL